MDNRRMMQHIHHEEPGRPNGRMRRGGVCRARARRVRMRRGLSALEVVIITGISLPLMALFAYAGIRLCRHFFSFLGSLVGSPLM